MKNKYIAYELENIMQLRTFVIVGFFWLPFTSARLDTHVQSISKSLNGWKKSERNEHSWRLMEKKTEKEQNKNKLLNQPAEIKFRFR